MPNPRLDRQARMTSGVNIWNFPIKKRLYNFSVGKTVNGKSPEVSGIFSTDPLVNLEHFDTNFMGAADCGYIVSTEKPAKK